MNGLVHRYALAVDDDRSFLQVLQLMLRLCGFTHTILAKDGTAALELLEKWRFDIIVGDWNIEPMDGLALLQRVRGNPLTAKTPFVLLTASLSETAWRKAIEYGATDILLKPIRLDSLRSACRICLQVQEMKDPNIISLHERLPLRYHLP